MLSLAFLYGICFLIVSPIYDLEDVHAHTCISLHYKGKGYLYQMVLSAAMVDGCHVNAIKCGLNCVCVFVLILYTNNVLFMCSKRVSVKT